jgi:hypothetical protein
MNERREQPLTTADVASASERPTQEPPARAGQRNQPEAPAQPRPTAGGPTDGKAKAEPEATPLFQSGQEQEFRSRWNEIQTGFVDEPRRAVEQADGLVAEVIKRLAETFANERTKLEGQWSRGEDVDTEDLRVALQRYRSFFDRLLSL